MKAQRLVIAGLIAACFCWAPCLMAEQTPPADVLKAAEAGLPEYLLKIPLPEMEQYGFAPGDDLRSATLGTPFLLHTIAPTALAQFRAGTPVASIITPTTLWYFPVQIAGQTKAILVVDRLDNQWQAVSLGYAPLARELGAMSSRWKATEGNKPVLVVVYQARQYLFTVPEKDANNLTPLNPAKLPDAKARGDAYDVLGNAAEVLANLKPAVQNNLNQFK